MMPPSSRQSRLYCDRFGPTRETSLVTTPCRNSAAAAAAPRTSKRPMWLTSKIPAAVRTASCSSRTLVYCWGISHPAKSTRRAPAAWCSECRGVRLVGIRPVALIEEDVQVDVPWLQVLHDLLVVPALRVGHDPAALLRALDRPLELRGQH